MTSRSINFYFCFFFTVYSAGLIFVLLYTAFLNLLDPGAKRIPLQIKPQFLGTLVFGCLMHVFLAAEGAHEQVQRLADHSGTLRLLWVGFLAGLLEIFVGFVFLCASFLVMKSVGLEKNLGIVVIAYVCAFLLPPKFIPLVVVYHFSSKAHNHLE
jgi:hypothetical protein